MDLSTMTDTNELKALAYDQLRIREQTDANLQALNARIAQLEEIPLEPTVEPLPTT